MSELIHRFLTWYAVWFKFYDFFLNGAVLENQVSHFGQQQQLLHAWAEQTRSLHASCVHIQEVKGLAAPD